MVNAFTYKCHTYKGIQELWRESNIGKLKKMDMDESIYDGYSNA